MIDSGEWHSESAAGVVPPTSTGILAAGSRRALDYRLPSTSNQDMTTPVDSDDMTTEPRNVLLFKEWFVSHGGSFHPGVRYSKSSSGFSIVAASEAIVEPDATIVTCPFSIIITPLLAKNALLPILLQLQLHQDSSTTQSTQAMMERWTERQSIIVYVCFHWIASPEM